jgi:hypothetical protein
MFFMSLQSGGAVSALSARPLFAIVRQWEDILCKPPAVGGLAPSTSLRAGCRRGERRVSVSQPSPDHPTDEDLSLHPCEHRSLPSPQRAKIARYHPKKQVPLLGGPGRWEPRVRGNPGKARMGHPAFFGLPARFLSGRNSTRRFERMRMNGTGGFLEESLTKSAS